jgi:hypothetical protein
MFENKLCFFVVSLCFAIIVIGEDFDPRRVHVIDRAGNEHDEFSEHISHFV